MGLTGIFGGHHHQKYPGRKDGRTQKIVEIKVSMKLKNRQLSEEKTP
jgi:hypothetical protein